MPFHSTYRPGRNCAVALDVFRYHYFVVFGHRRRCLISAVYSSPRGSSGPLRLLFTFFWSYPRHGSRSGHPRPHWGRHRYSYHGRRLEHSHPPRNAPLPFTSLSPPSSRLRLPPMFLSPVVSLDPFLYLSLSPPTVSLYRHTRMLSHHLPPGAIT